MLRAFAQVTLDTLKDDPPEAGISLLSDDPQSPIQRVDVGVSQGIFVANTWARAAKTPSSAFGGNAPDDASTSLSIERLEDHWRLAAGGKELARFSAEEFPGNGMIMLGVYAAPNTSFSIHTWELQVPTVGDTDVKLVSPSVEVGLLAEGLPLRCYAEARGLNWGVASVNSEGAILDEDPNYLARIATHFDIVTPSSMMKIATTEPARGKYNFAWPDILVRQSQVYDFQVRGHTLVWGLDLPKWITDEEWSRDEMIAIMHDFIYAEVSRYRGRVPVWDVVNEAIDPNTADGFAHNAWYRAIGPEYIDMAFSFAHKADPDALLFYNDYLAEGRGRKSDLVFNLVQGMKERGVPIDGVGMQMHFYPGNAPTTEDVSTNMQRISELGLIIHVTEMDVWIEDWPGSLETRLELQAEIYASMLRACLQNGACTNFTVWTAYDNDIWPPRVVQSGQGPGIFDWDNLPKPAYFALEDVLRTFP